MERTWSFGWFADDGLAVAVVANSWGHGARSAEMVDTALFAARCMGWPDPGG